MNSVFQNGGVYVVIGGAGGVGEVFSEYVARTYRAHVIWLGRRAPSREIDEKIARIAAHAPAPEYIQADAADLRSMQSAYQAIKARHPRINGLVHSAIVLQDQSLAQMSVERMQASLAPKLDVSVRMAQVFGREALDFVLFFSSFQSFAKAPGQSNYAAGCTFKDAFAHQLRHAWSCRVKIVNWGYWGSVGIVASEAMRARMAKIGLASIEAPEAMQAIESLLAGPRDQVVLLKTHSSDLFLPGPPRAGTLTWLPSQDVPVELPAQAIRAAADKVELPTLPVHGDDAESLVAAAAQVLLCQLQAMGLFLPAGRANPEPARAVAPRYAKWLQESRRVLLERGLLRQDSGACEPRERIDTARAWADWETCKRKVVAVTGRESDLALVETTLRELPAILGGRRLATDVLFPKSSLSQVAGVYHENPQTTYYNEVLARALDVVLRNKLAAQPDCRFRLFEVGAGTGGTSVALFKHLEAFAANIETYVYTDISKAFLLHAESAFRARAPYLKTQLFNVEKPLAAQNIRAGSFDVVIAANVLHATRNMHRTLHNCKALLKRGGVLLLNEMAMNTLFSHLTFGLLDGWWLPEDSALRIPGCPGLAPSAWARLLGATGFSPVLFPCERAHERGQAVIVAQSDGLVRPLELITSPANGTITPAEKRPASPSTATGRRSPSTAGFTETTVAMTEGPLVKVATLDPQRAAAALSQEAPAPTQMAREYVAQLITEHISTQLKVPLKTIEADQPFADYGVDSITGVQIVLQVNRDLGIELETTTLFDHPTIEKLSEHIVTTFAISSVPRAGNAPALRIVKSEASAPQVVTSERAREAMDEGRDASVARAPVPVAIVGLSGRFAGSDSLEAFWQHLANGDDLVQVVSRWNLPEYDSGFASAQKGYCRHGSFLSDVDLFDAAFFNISAVEAKFMDPQQRLFLEESWKALENAGYAGASMEGARCGVYVGAGPGDYAQLMRSAGPPQAFWGNASSVLASRIAYHLDLKGPAVAIDTACSSSLVALHLACQSLWLGETDLALAGGVFVQSTPNFYLLAGRSGMLSASGRCHTFDARADGFVPGEGVGVVVLRRLDDALADGDYIHGIIRGTGVNQDGATNGITAPSAQSQEQLERSIYENFAIDPSRIQLVEAHGTGTELGDPIEFQALTRAFRAYTQEQSFCAIGSVKSNIGHAAPAAGIAGLFKLLLALRHRQIPPSIHFEQCNPAIDVAASPFYVNTQLRDWPAPVAGPRMAALSSFGFSGTNAHVVIEEAQRVEREHAPRPAYLIALSARSEAKLREQVERLLSFCETQPQADPGNLSFTLLLGRRPLEHRLAAIVTDLQDLTVRLSKWAKIGQCAQVYVGHAGETGRQQQAALKRYGNQCLLECGQDLAMTGYVERLAVVAELFVQGYQLDCRALFRHDAFSRVPLPLYPFDRKRHWVDEQPIQAPVPSQVAGTGHPLLQRNTSTLRAIQFSSRFSGEEYFLRDHQIQGRRILPGVAHLELARAAVQEAEPQASAVQLFNIRWLRPAEVIEGRLSLNVRLRPRGDADLDYDIVAADGGNVMYSQGKARLLATPPTAPRVPLRDALSRCQAYKLTHDLIYSTFSQLGFAYGPAHQALQALHLGSNAQGQREVVAELELPTAAVEGAEAFHLHPSLLDGALQACMGLHVPLENETASGADRGPEVPFALERLDIYARCPAKVWAWVRASAGSSTDPTVRRLDVSLCDEKGQVCVEFGAFAWRALTPTQAREPARERETRSSALVLAPTWESSPVAAQPGAAAVEDGNHWVLLLGAFPQWANTELQQSLTEAHCEQISPESAPGQSVYEATAARAFALLQRILRDKPKRATLLQVVIAARTEAQFCLAGVAALLRTASLESSNLITQCIELESTLDAAAMSELLRKDARAPNDHEIRYRHGRREVRSLRLVDTLQNESNPPQARSAPWREAGVYLVTGGLGGLGLVVAKDIAAHARGARLFLVGRGEPGASQTAALKELKTLGAAVEYRRLDVADAAAVRGLIEQIVREHSGLTGIVHSAGVLRDSLIVNKTPQDLQTVLAPKVSGLIHLDEATSALDLEWFVLFSSVVGVMGNPGQADYAAANGFMDAFAHYRNRLVARGLRKGKTLSINWPLWERGGMQVDAAAVSRLRANGMVPMTNEQGLAVLSYGIRSVELGSQATVFVRAEETGKSATERLSQAAVTAAAKASASSTQYTVGDSAGNHAERAAPNPARPPHHTSERQLLGRVQELVVDMVRELLQVPAGEVDLHRQLNEYGFDSLSFTELGNRLQARCGVQLSPTIFFEHATLGSFAAYLTEAHTDTLAAALQAQPGDSATSREPEEPRARAFPELRDPAPASHMATRAVAVPEPLVRSTAPAAVGRAAMPFEPIAIIGVSGCFPQAADVEEFWRVLKEGRDCITEIPADRWDWRALYGEPGERNFKTNVKWGGFVAGVKTFDPLFFGIHPREAELMDPQRRLLLTHAWQVIEDAGYAPSSLSGSRTAIFMGTGETGYSNLTMAAGKMDGFSTTGLSPSIGPNRVSFQLNLHGPSEPIETACSSALVAIHRAVTTLRAGQCDLVLAGGVNTIVTPTAHIGLSKMGMLSADGRCKAFSAEANGYVRSEGVGVLLLKRLQDAEADGDHIYGLILHSGENHGGRASSLTAPNAKAQSELVRAVYLEARIDPRTITYIEAHGTGTRLGDPVEVNGLKSAFGALYAATAESTLPPARCGLGSVKSNIGHLELASGVAGIIKVLLQMKHRTLVRTLHCEPMNPLIELADSPFYILDKERPWQALLDEHGAPIPRRAGVSSFGVGGVNAHIVLEEYTSADEYSDASAQPGEPRVIVLSARTEQQLLQQARNLLKAVRERGYGDRELTRIAYTLQVGRDAMGERLGLVAPDMQTVVAKLMAFLKGQGVPPGVYRGQAKKGKGALPAFQDSEELQQRVTGWAQLRRFDALLEMWVQGLNFPWRTLYGARPPRRIALPTYPFSQDPYWVERAPEPAEPAARSTPGTTRLHPLVHRNSSTLDAIRFSSEFTGEEFFLRDHVVQGRKILPGVAHIETARAALIRAAGEGGAYELRDIFWLRPLAAEGAATALDIVLRPASEQLIQIEILAGSPRQVCSRARAQKSAPVPAAPIDLARLQQVCAQSPLAPADIYRIFDSSGLTYGTSFRTIERLQVGNHDGKPQALAWLSLPESAAADHDDSLIHPGLLDGSLQTSLGLSLVDVGQASGLAIPFSLQVFRTHGRCPSQVWAWVRFSADSTPRDSVRKLDITLIDADGRVCVELLGLTSREVAAPGATSNTTTASRPAIRPEPVVEPLARTVCLMPRWRASEIAPNAQARAAGSNCHVLLLEGFESGDAELVRNSLAAQSGPARVDCRVSSASGGLADRYKTHALETLRLLREIAGGTGAPTLVQIVVGGASADTAECFGGLALLLKTASSENPRILGQCITLDRPLAAAPLAALLQANATQLTDSEVRYRDGRREARELAELAVEGQAPAAHRPWREDGVYLITGGLGGLGLIFARDILKTARGARVMLCGRAALDATKQNLLDSLLQHGVAEYWQVDVGQSGAVRALIDAIRRKHGHLTGILHSAGLALDKHIVSKSEADAALVLAPKVAGVVNLDEATAALPLDFFVAFSSVAGVFGNPGQADYAAANAFMDRYIERRQVLVNTGARSGKSLSVNWPLWAEGGMNVSETMRTLFARNYGIVPLPTNVGLELLSRCLAANEPQVIVIHGHQDRLMQGTGGAAPRPEEKAAPPPPRGEAPAVSDSLPGRQHSGHVTGILRDALAKWLKVKADDIDTSSDFADLGFDSVSLTEFSLWLNSEYQLALNPAIFIEHPAIAGFSDYLATQYPEKFPAASAVAAPPRPASAAVPAGAASEMIGRAAASTENAQHVSGVMRQALAKWLKVKADDIDTSGDFADLGFDSVSLTEFSLWLNTEFQLNLNPAIFVEHPGIASFCEYLITQHPDKFLPANGASATSFSPPPAPPPVYAAQPMQFTQPAGALAGAALPGSYALSAYEVVSSTSRPEDHEINAVQGAQAPKILEYQRRAFAPAELARFALLQTSQGLNVDVMTAGRGRTILLLPPFGILASAWLYPFVELSKRYRVVALNYPGCGRSEFSSQHSSLESIAQQAFDCLDALGCEECDVVGWSMGACIAQIMTVTQPQRVRTLTLVNTVTRASRDLSLGDVTELLRSGYTEFATHLPAEGAEEGARAQNRLEFFKATYVPYVLSHYATLLLEFDLRGHLERLGDIRALILAGGKDPWSRLEDSRRMQQQIRRAEYCEQEDAGHCIPLQYREWFNSKLVELLESSRAEVAVATAAPVFGS